MIKETTRITILPIIIIFLLTACNSDMIYTDSVAMPQQTWSLSDIVDFTAPIDDTTCISDVYFTIRTGSEYPYRNIFLFVTTTSPDGNKMTDTLEYYLADEKGNWFGRGAGDVHELNLPYRSMVFFPRKGNYNFTIRHGMRIGDLKGVYDIGINIRELNR
ncbi:MAG TPA: gliding motility lipoprotein GldH [Bacteroidales bacterium]|jgi:gliding motility-associated lipoprotein GldH|nr:gliding motility lipoprotein GldH [Bacteroidales bacterium]HQB36544.1 gliding motility lipoprotein GldH [Bacteroidales bacterium]